MTDSDLSRHIGRTQTAFDRAQRSAFDRLNALFDRPGGSGDFLPPLGHWLCFLPDAPQSDIGPDGHPGRGGLYPELGLPLRMWAGSRISFRAPLPFDTDLEKRAILTALSRKQGRTGDLVFATVRHEVFAGGRLCVEEEQDIVFRNRSASPDRPGAPPPEPDVRRMVRPEETFLFRFSALTYNAHRIHYDRPYTTEVEGYPGLLVHGPLQAMLMMDLFARTNPGAAVKHFEVRAERPLFDPASFSVNYLREAGGARVWTADAGGRTAMSGRVEV